MFYLSSWNKEIRTYLSQISPSSWIHKHQFKLWKILHYNDNTSFFVVFFICLFVFAEHNWCYFLFFFLKVLLSCSLSLSPPSFFLSPLYWPIDSNFMLTSCMCYDFFNITFFDQTVLAGSLLVNYISSHLILDQHLFLCN